MSLRWIGPFRKHRRQGVTDTVLFLVYVTLFVSQFAPLWSSGRLDFIETSYAIHTLMMAVMFLIRAPHRQLNKKLPEQAVAVFAFLSGALLIGGSVTATGTPLAVSQAVIATANVLGLLTLVNLGRSFGVLIAFRAIRSTGLYAIVRHPMYATDIMLRVGYFMSHTTFFVGAVVVLSSACYIYRALLEERFLMQQPEYEAYARSVKYRFIPYLY